MFFSFLPYASFHVQPNTQVKTFLFQVMTWHLSSFFLLGLLRALGGFVFSSHHHLNLPNPGCAATIRESGGPLSVAHICTTVLFSILFPEQR